MERNSEEEGNTMQGKKEKKSVKRNPIGMG
jgi:hypothetical protein